MIRYLPIFLIVLSCSGPATNYNSYGEEISSSDAMEVTKFLSMVSQDEADFKVAGVIEEVCQMKGCWMTLRNEEGVSVRVTFKDYGFFVPKDISGKEVIIEGKAVKEVLEEDLAKHYAEDSGKEYDESMRNTITFVAHGVLVAQS